MNADSHAIAAAIRIQAVFRGFRARKEYVARLLQSLEDAEAERDSAYERHSAELEAASIAKQEAHDKLVERSRNLRNSDVLAQSVADNDESDPFTVHHAAGMSCQTFFILSISEKFDSLHGHSQAPFQFFSDFDRRCVFCVC